MTDQNSNPLVTATGDLFGNKSADKITKTESQSNPENPSQTDEKSIEIPKEKYLSLEKKQKIIEYLRFK